MGALGISSILIIAAALVVLFILIKGICIVEQGSEYVVETLGKYTSTLKPGLHVIIPLYQSVAAKIVIKEQVLDVETQICITKDNTSVHVDGVAFYAITDAAAAVYQVNDLDRAMINLAMTNIRTVVGSMDLDDLLSQRDEINARLLKVIDEAAGNWGVRVTRVEIKNIEPPADILEAMARQKKAEQYKRAEILEAEGRRQAEILRAEGEKQAQVLEAEGRKEAAFRDAEARERSAEAEALATRTVSEAIAGGDVNALNYFIADKYVKALGQIASSGNDKVIMMPLETTGVIGAVEGIRELTANFSNASAKSGAPSSVPSSR